MLVSTGLEGHDRTSHLDPRIDQTENLIFTCVDPLESRLPAVAAIDHSHELREQQLQPPITGRTWTFW